MDIKELKAALVAKGWTEDRFGHMKKEVLSVKQGDPQPGVVLFRVKVQKMSVRLERQYEIEADRYSPARKEWSNITSSYLKDIKIRPDGGIIIGRKVIA